MSYFPGMDTTPSDSFGGYFGFRSANNFLNAFSNDGSRCQTRRETFFFAEWPDSAKHFPESNLSAIVHPANTNWRGRRLSTLDILIKVADLNSLVQGGQLYWAFPLSFGFHVWSNSKLPLSLFVWGGDVGCSRNTKEGSITAQLTSCID